MDYTAVAEVGCAGFAVISGVFGWLWQRSEGARDKAIQENSEAIDALAKTLAASDRQHGEELAAFKLHCAETYVTGGMLQKTIDTLSEAIRAVFAKLERIEDKLDGKADK
jgi:hypothetical protein